MLDENHISRFDYREIYLVTGLNLLAIPLKTYIIHIYQSNNQ